jgi:hypothetical protein
MRWARWISGILWVGSWWIVRSASCASWRSHHPACFLFATTVDRRRRLRAGDPAASVARLPDRAT